MIDEKSREDLVAYMDGECSPEERAAIERRLRNDSDLARELESLREVDALLERYPAPDPRGDLAERVLSRARPGGLGARLRILRPVLAAAALLVVATIVIVIGRGGPTPIEPLPDATPQAAIENLHALEYLALLDEIGEDTDAILEDPGLLDEASAILAAGGEELEDR